jgi:hypothetical protein
LQGPSVKAKLKCKVEKETKKEWKIKVMKGEADHSGCAWRVRSFFANAFTMDTLPR